MEMADIEAAMKAAAARQPAAFANIEKARGLYAELADQFTDQALKSECYEGCAKAEAVLLGKDGISADEARQRTARLREALDKVAETAADTPRGNRAKELAEKLRGGDFQTELRNVQ